MQQIKAAQLSVEREQHKASRGSVGGQRVCCGGTQEKLVLYFDFDLILIFDLISILIFILILIFIWIVNVIVVAGARDCGFYARLDEMRGDKGSCHIPGDGYFDDADGWRDEYHVDEAMLGAYPCGDACSWCELSACRARAATT